MFKERKMSPFQRLVLMALGQILNHLAYETRQYRGNVQVAQDSYTVAEQLITVAEQE